MKQRTLDEMISYFNQQVSEMDIKHEDKIKLLGMITAIGYEAQKHKWIPCSERLPEEHGHYLVTVHLDYIVPGGGGVDMLFYNGAWCYYDEKFINFPDPIIAWMPLPEPYKMEVEHER